MSVEQHKPRRSVLGQEPSTASQMQEAERLLLQFQGLFGKPEGVAEGKAGGRPEGKGTDGAGAEERPLARQRPPATPAQAAAPPLRGGHEVASASVRADAARAVPAVIAEGGQSKRPSDQDAGAAAAAASRAVGASQAMFSGKAPGTLVLRGGGARCAAYAGLAKRLEEGKLLSGVATFIGISGGAQAAALLAFGCGSQELAAALRRAPRRGLLDSAGFPCGACRNFFRLFRHHGVCKGNALEGYFDELFKEKVGRARCTFRQLYEWSGKELRLGACNVATRELEFLDRHSHPDMPVCVAARAASSLPILFRPVRVGKVLYLDGSLAGKVPISTLANGEQVLALNLLAKSGGERKGPPATFMQFLDSSLHMLQESAPGVEGFDIGNERSHLNSDNIDVINIDAGKAASFDTVTPDGAFDELLKSGYDAVARYLRPTTE